MRQRGARTLKVSLLEHNLWHEATGVIQVGSNFWVSEFISEHCQYLHPGEFVGNA